MTARLIAAGLLALAGAAAQSGLDALDWRAAIEGTPEASRLVHRAAPASSAEWSRALAAAEQAGAAVLVAPPDAAGPVPATRLRIAIEGDPQRALATAARLGPSVAVWADLPAWERSGVSPLAALSMIRSRLAGGRLAAGPATDEFLKEAYRLELKPLVWLLAAGNSARTVATLDSLVHYHRNYGGRTAGARRIGGVTAEDRGRIEAALPATAPATPRRPRKVLVFDLNVGRFGHPSIPYANLAVERMGERTGAYRATVSSDPAMLDPEKLRGFDAVFLNNTIGDIFPTAAAREGFAEFVRRGGGIVANHAATVTATEWPEFGEILGARGAAHRMTDEKAVIRIEDSSHPLTRAFGSGPFEYADEFFRFQPPYSRDKVRVLLSIDPQRTDLNQGRCYGNCLRDDHDYPVAWIRQYGEGRVFYTTLGHNPHVFMDARLLQFFLAALQYATGDLPAEAAPRPAPSPDWDGILAKLSGWSRGADPAPAAALDAAMRVLGASEASRAAAESKFAAFLGSGASSDSKELVCRQLASIGTARSVTAVAALLNDAALGGAARDALERISGEASAAALRQALERGSGRSRLGAVHSLARLGDAASVPRLIQLASGTDGALRDAAVDALGMIGTPEAEKALLAMKVTPGVADALARLAERAPAQRAAGVYEVLRSGPPAARAAAIRGLARVGATSAPAAARAGLSDGAPAVRIASVQALARIDASALEAALPKLAAADQVVAIEALGTRGPARNLLTSESPGVRRAAIDVLARTGTADDVAALVRLAATPSGPEQEAARFALARLPDASADDAIARALASSSGAEQLELIRAAGQRGSSAAADALVSAAGSRDAAVRRLAARALRDTAGPRHTAAIVALLGSAADDERGDLERALAGSDVTEAFRGGSGELKVSLARVLGMSGKPDALPLLEQALASPDPELRRAAVSSLAGWPTPEPMSRLLEIARNGPDAPLRVLALRGYVRLATLPSERPPAETASMLGNALKAAVRPDEKKLILAALQRTPCAESLALARAAASDPAVEAEARAAVRSLESALAPRN